MTSRGTSRARIEQERLLVIVRRDQPQDWIAEALVEAGVGVVEISLVSEGATAAVRRWAERFAPGLLVGAGTVLTADHAARSIEAGARFLVAPTFDEEVLAAAIAADVLYIPGAFTPSELARAHTPEVPLVKLFPAGSLGPDYVRDVLAPLPGLRLVATGGVGADNARAFLSAGAAAVAVGSAVVRDGATPADVLDAANRLRRLTITPTILEGVADDGD
jgi:2-dehydro-3-deoxyphosphogluconate aldolase/(4S)-4-hydroxy-2-oxoglutarate aldolase